jgi:hypothetical protein
MVQGAVVTTLIRIPETVAQQAFDARDASQLCGLTTLMLQS